MGRIMPQVPLASRNPYRREDGVPLLRKSVVAFIDILGYTDLVYRASKQNQSQQLLLTLHSALQKARKHVDPEQMTDFVRTVGKEDFFAFRAFTDNIVLGHPVLDDAESELGHVFFQLSYFQMIMTMEGFFVRGGIGIGDLYMDDITVFGNGLIDAHDAENTLARNPRIVLAPSAHQAVDQHLKYYATSDYAPQSNALLKDADGQYFLDYMTTLIREDGGIFKNELERHKERIEEKLAKHRSSPPIWSKYLWSATYHNYFCDCFRGEGEEARINTEELVLKPVRL